MDIIKYISIASKKAILGAFFFYMLLITQAYSQNQPNSQIIGNEISLPEFTTFDRIMRLKKGMNKTQVLEALEIYPYKIIYNEKNECEINVFKCAIAFRSMALKNVPVKGSPEQINSGNTIYGSSFDEIILFYQKGKLELFINKDKEMESYQLLILEKYTNSHCSPTKDTADALELDLTNFLEPKVVPGCRDTSALNFDPVATIQKEGSCKYAKCGYVKLYLTDAEKKGCNVKEIPGDDLWNYWLSDGNCNEIRKALAEYPPLFRKLPKSFFSDCNENLLPKTKDCDWCDLMKSKGISTPSQIQFNWSK